MQGNMKNGEIHYEHNPFSKKINQIEIVDNDSIIDEITEEEIRNIYL